MVTRNDVANLAGVSPTVVSYVINGHKHVSEAKREAVKAAIKKLDYVPNSNARSLKMQKSLGSFQSRYRTCTISDY